MHCPFFWKKLRDDEDGAALMEFAIVGPVFILVLMSLFDFGQWMYARSVLNGVTQNAARLATLETGDAATADARVYEMVSAIAPDATIKAERLSYFDFSDIGRPEKWNDEDNNGTCNNGEGFVDENDNERWDADIGNSDNGAASDVVLYTVTITYTPSFAMPLLPHVADKREISQTVVKKNQPYALQTNYTSEAGTCD